MEEHVNAFFSRASRILGIASTVAMFVTSSARPATAQEHSQAGIDLQRAVKQVRFDRAVAAAAAQAGSSDSPVLKFFASTELSGFVDTYYSYNFNRPADGSNMLYNFNVYHNAFSFNLAEIALTKAPTPDSRAGFRLDLDYGPAAAMVNAFEPGRPQQSWSTHSRPMSATSRRARAYSSMLASS